MTDMTRDEAVEVLRGYSQQHGNPEDFDLAIAALQAQGEPDGYTSYGEFRWACDCTEQMRREWTPVFVGRPPAAQGEPVAEDFPIQCEVAVAPGTMFGVGVRLSTVLASIRLRNEPDAIFPGPYKFSAAYKERRLAHPPAAKPDAVAGLVEKWRGEAKDLMAKMGGIEAVVAAADAIDACADELAAALGRGEG